MLRGSGDMASVSQAALRAPPGKPARIVCEIINDVVEVKMKRWTPCAAAASSRLSVPSTFVATKSAFSWCSMFGLCSAPPWTMASMPFSLTVLRTSWRSATEPTTSVCADGTGSRPINSWLSDLSLGASALPSQPDDPVSKIRIDQTVISALTPLSTHDNDRRTGKLCARRQNGCRSPRSWKRIHDSSPAAHGWESGLTVIYLQDFEEEVWAPAC